MDPADKTGCTLIKACTLNRLNTVIPLRFGDSAKIVFNVRLNVALLKWEKVYKYYAVPCFVNAGIVSVAF